MKKICIVALLLLAACSPSKRGMSELKPEENNELNQYISRRDECYSQEAARLDDGKSDVGQLTELVMWKCQQMSGRISSLLYDKFNVDLSSSYAYKTTMDETSRRQVTEAILTNRKLAQNQDWQENAMTQRVTLAPVVAAPMGAGATQAIPAMPEVPNLVQPVQQGLQQGVQQLQRLIPNPPATTSPTQGQGQGW